MILCVLYFFFFSSRRRHTRYWRDWSSDVCSSDLFPLFASLTPLFDLFYFLCYLFVSGILQCVVLKIIQLLANFTSFFFGCLVLTNLSDSVFYLLIAFLKEFFRLFLRFADNLFAAFFQRFYFGFIVGDSPFQVFFSLVNALPFVLPIALITHNVLQILVTLNVVTAHDFSCLIDDFFGQSYLSGNLNGKAAARATYRQLE